MPTHLSSQGGFGGLGGRVNPNGELVESDLETRVQIFLNLSGHSCKLFRALSTQSQFRAEIAIVLEHISEVSEGLPGFAVERGGGRSQIYDSCKGLVGQPRLTLYHDWHSQILRNHTGKNFHRIRAEFVGRGEPQADLQGLFRTQNPDVDCFGLGER